jgi:(1->4)-alpha-D-glucan 1-alpha-D-glucosylmutase
LRARLAVISEIPERWAEEVQAWRQLNFAARTGEGKIPAPDQTDEYLLYQMLAGAWPLVLAVDDGAGLRAFFERIADWQQKAIREAKRRSGWIEPNLQYEEGCRTFVERLLDPHASQRFLRRIVAFVDSIAAAGAVNGLTQTLLRMTIPGVPDLYQGCELWDFSLVDPDNRRAVDFALRARDLDARTGIGDLVATWRDGRIKQHLIAKVLRLRRQQPQLFARGAYQPLPVHGPLAEHVLAFLRHGGSRTVLVAATRLPAVLLDHGGVMRIDPQRWLDTSIRLPPRYQERRWTEIVSGRQLGAGTQEVCVAKIFRDLPAAILADWTPD